MGESEPNINMSDIISKLRWLEVQAAELHLRASILRAAAELVRTTRRPIFITQDKRWFLDLYQHFYHPLQPVRNSADPVQMKSIITSTHQYAQQIRAQSQQLRLSFSQNEAQFQSLLEKRRRLSTQVQLVLADRREPSRQ